MPARPSHLLALTAAVLAALALSAPAAPAAATKVCRSADLRYPYEPGGPKTFGVFRLQVTGGSCRTAHAVAKRWQDRFESNLRAGKAVLPKRVSGFTFRQLPAHAAQTYTLRGRNDGSTTIRFDYVVPNG